MRGQAPLITSYANLQFFMFKNIFKRVKQFYDNEYEGKITVEFGFIDILFLILIVFLVIKLIF